MKIVTSAQIAGAKITSTLGLVRGNTIRARQLGRDIMAGFRMFIGRELNDYTKMLAEAREQSPDRLADEARSLGANAIIDVRFSTSYIAASAAEILVYGTAVIIEEE